MMNDIRIYTASGMSRLDWFMMNLPFKSYRNVMRGLCTPKDCGFRSRSIYADNHTRPVKSRKFSCEKIPFVKVWTVNISDPELGNVLDDYFYTYEEACCRCNEIPNEYLPYVEKAMIHDDLIAMGRR